MDDMTVNCPKSVDYEVHSPHSWGSTGIEWHCPGWSDDEEAARQAAAHPAKEDAKSMLAAQAEVIAALPEATATAQRSSEELIEQIGELDSRRQKQIAIQRAAIDRLWEQITALENEAQDYRELVGRIATLVAKRVSESTGHDYRAFREIQVLIDKKNGYGDKDE